MEEIDKYYRQVLSFWKRWAPRSPIETLYHPNFVFKIKLDTLKVITKIVDTLLLMKIMVIRKKGRGWQKEDDFRGSGQPAQISWWLISHLLAEHHYVQSTKSYFVEDEVVCRRPGLHKLWYPSIRDTSTSSKFGAHGEHGDVFLFSNLSALWFSENLIRYILYVCLREVKNNFFSFKHSGWEHVKRKMHPWCAVRWIFPPKGWPPPL